MDGSDIVANLLALSSETESAGEFLPQAIELIRSGAKVSAVSIVRAQPPDWNVAAVTGVARGDVPTDMAADACEHNKLVSQADWQAFPLQVADDQESNATDAGGALLIRGKLAGEDFRALASTFDKAWSAVSVRERLQRRAQRLKSLLDITHEWHQTNETARLLVRMAEAATDFFAADRASIFLWDKPSRSLVGRPALGIEGGVLRIDDDAGVVGKVVQSGQPLRINDCSDTDVDRSIDRQTGYLTRSLLCVPLVAPDSSRLGAFELLNKKAGPFTEDDQRGLTEMAAYASIALQNTQQFEQLISRHEQLVAQAAENATLIGNTPAMNAIRSTIEKLANTNLVILILGENGTGKEVVARSLHYSSNRRKEPFLAVNCAALTETLLESELFGHEKGAFTDAHQARPGKFEAASGGTLFLDEIGDMSPGGQAKLLRVIEDKVVVRVGGSTPIHTDVRVLAATNQDLAELVQKKRFREDLFFRLNVVCIEMPPLRDRGDDIFLLAEHFLQGFCRDIGRKMPQLTAAARKRLLSHTWPGNVRELRNLMERVAYLSSDNKVDVGDLWFTATTPKEDSDAVAEGLDLNDATHEFQRGYIRRTVERARGNISEAAKQLGVHRSNLYRKMRQLGMEVGEDGET